MTDSPLQSVRAILDGFMADGLTRQEALALLYVTQGATHVTVEGGGSEQLEEMRQQVMALQAQAVRRENVIAALMKTMVPAYLTRDDVEQIIKQADRPKPVRG